MQKGFVFDSTRCVGCKACVAACILENGWEVQTRSIYTFNIDAIPTFPLTNLSLACNHCETAVCMEGCPTSAFSRDLLTGAIVIDEKKCIGCKYCQWNCPYDAPKFDKEKGTIVKCNLCYTGIIEGRLPACTSACPTGALNFEHISEIYNKTGLSWFPEKNLNPAIELSGKENISSLRIIPYKPFKQDISNQVDDYSSLKGKWSLAFFSFLTTLSVSTIISSLFRSVFPEKIQFITVILLAGLISMLHLGIKHRAWRVLSNLRTSPLSREIALFILYSLIAGFAVIFQIPAFLISAAAIGLILLFAIDSVYVYSDKRISVFSHGGQTFINALLIISFCTGTVFPFVFIALIKILSACYFMFSKRTEGALIALRFCSVSILFITGTSMISGISYSDTAIYLIFLTGVFFDRILFYVDFDPLNINSLINKQITAAANEKKRS